MPPSSLRRRQSDDQVKQTAQASSSSSSTSRSSSGMAVPAFFHHAHGLPGDSAGKANGGRLPSLNISLDAEDDEDEMLSFTEEADEVGQLSSDHIKGLPLSASSFSSSNASRSPTSALKLTPAEKREHSRKHSRMHSRNLSAFFPRPGTEAEIEADTLKAADTFRNQHRTAHMRPLSQVDTNNLDSKAALDSPEHNLGRADLQPSKSRRGHHRKHSVTHNLYRDTSTLSVGSSLGADSGYDSRYASDVSSSPVSPIDGRKAEKVQRPRLAAVAYDHHQRSHSATGMAKLLSTPVSQLLATSSLPPSFRPLLVFGACHFLLGVALWTSGQSGDSLAMLGLGYLVVFDAFGILNAVAGEWMTAKWRTEQNAGKLLRTPYGPHRVETLLHFTQTIFLLFASIYVCKESVEHALLEGTDEHHEQHEEDDVGLRLPQTLLLVTTFACAFSTIILQNHAKLVAACGISTAASEVTGPESRLKRGHGRNTSVLVDPVTMAGPLLQLFTNPFGLMVLFFSATLSFASVAMPPIQVAALDKVLASLESAAMLYVAYPASKALGKILLQTAPQPHNTQNVQLNRSLQTIQGHKLVTYVAPPNLWQLTPPTSALKAIGGVGNGGQAMDAGLFGDASSTMLGGVTGSRNRVAKNATLIASVEIFVRDEASDNDVLDITGWAWRLLAPAVGAGAGLPTGESLRGGIRAGEIIVQVSREAEREKQRRIALATFGDGHAHDHEHGCHSHAHGHDHDHDHDHDHHDHHHHAHHHHHHHTHDHKHDNDSQHAHKHHHSNAKCDDHGHHARECNHHHTIGDPQSQDLSNSHSTARGVSHAHPHTGASNGHEGSHHDHSHVHTPNPKAAEAHHHHQHHHHPQHPISPPSTQSPISHHESIHAH